MKDIRAKIFVYPDEELILFRLCDEYNMNLSTLIRECNFSSFNKYQITMSFSDLFTYSSICNDISESVKKVISAAESDNIFPAEISKIEMAYKKNNETYSRIYKSIQFERKEISSKLERKFKRIKQSELSKQVINKIDKKSQGKPKPYLIRMEPKERDLIKAKAKEQGIPMTDYLKNNVFKKCSLKRAVIDTCPLEKHNEELKGKNSILAAIAGKSKSSILSQRDLMNVIYLLEDIAEIQEQIDKEIQGIDIDKEIQRILAERSEIHGSSKN